MDDSERWEAVVRRDGSADGAFVFGVVTTGVYCRPSCPARRPRREHVRFFADPRQAREAGLRACRRCGPDGPAPAVRRRELVTAACRAVEGAGGGVTAAVVATDLGVSLSHLQRTFRAETGLTLKAYAAAVRARSARGELTRSGSVTEAIHRAGYGSSSRFYESSPERLGMTPTAYRAGGAGEEVRVATAATALGAVVVAATARGVCAIELGDDPAELLAAVRRRFHAARITTDDPAFAALVDAVVAVVEGSDPPPSGPVELPLDLRGTAFQERVWRTLRAVPAGTTVTYAELARLAGAPGSARAVAGACAANRLAIAVPCHRVVRADGTVSGYRWGVDRKRRLLDREQQAADRDDPFRTHDGAG
jgi:AraC family transcriptional regulator, regulatory protein of adaptative response / methylated-DNA-[protein]-cysteine methyltransferase